MENKQFFLDLKVYTNVFRPFSTFEDLNTEIIEFLFFGFLKFLENIAAVCYHKLVWKMMN